ncbi:MULTISPECIES: TetR/AcrR family transcriptional regulator [Niastella]|uniref:TetR/AcrR family transcriptional regulator n=1 Tax=Niastella soli TaxID=2821487 RepID=A0ABS3YVW5_9BACT|nr:TetR/AcrR family transcriptional regulator [Niastella soli]MBO9201550.1 TetR/AcrR family transcriptional regulator [Niastella soli]
MKEDLSEDRRIQKTKKLLADSLGQLMREKEYDAITIQDIIDKANVGRSTFYAHYESKEKLLLNNINFQRELIHFNSDDPQHPMGINLPYLFNHLAEYSSIVKVIHGTSIGYQMAEHFAGIMVAKIVGYYKRKPLPPGMDLQLLQYRAEAVAAGIVRMVFCWVLEDTPIAVSKMIVQAQELLKGVLPPFNRE